MFKFLHAADVHLDSPLKGLDRYETAPAEQIRSSTRRALERLIQVALSEQVDFVVLAGDLYDGDWPDYNTGLFFRKEVSRLRDADIPVWIIAGNHDAANRITRSLQLPDHVHVFSASAPETSVLDDLGVAIHGQSFAKAAVYDDLSEAYPAAHRGCFNIGLLHTSATGREGHERYAPCSLEGLRRKGYDYWALGHIHQREVLCRDPFIAFPGNLQGRHIRETGAKGCLLVTVQDDRSLATQFVPLDVVRWETSRIDITDLQTTDDLRQRVEESFQDLSARAEERLLVVRLELTGCSTIHRDLLADTSKWIAEFRGLADQVRQDAVWLEKVKFYTQEDPQQLELEGQWDGPLGELGLLFEELLRTPDPLSSLDIDFEDLGGKLPADWKQRAPWSDPDALLTILKESRAYLQGKLRIKDGCP